MTNWRKILYKLSMLEVIVNPNPILRKMSQPVADVLNPEIQELIPQMIETMLAEDGVGLAAPQIGKNIRMVVIRYEDEDLTLINPLVVTKSFFKEWGEEGCLSVPGKIGEVKRYKRVKVKFLDAENKEQILEAQGLLARILQHEIDHLDGVLFIDKARKIKTAETYQE